MTADVIGEIKLATPFVEPGFSFEYALMRFDNSIITKRHLHE